MSPDREIRAVVVGGSIGGLTVALLLRELGFAVDVYERTPTVLEGNGGGIVLQEDTIRWFAERSSQNVAALCRPTHRVQYLNRSGDVVYHEYRVWNCTSWGTIYRALLADFGTGHYHCGEYACGFSQDEHRAAVQFQSGRTEFADLVVFADGVGSVAREAFDPNAAMQYAGYIGWRATVARQSLSAGTLAVLDDAITYNVIPNSHAAVYPIPGESASAIEGTMMNLIWYRNMPAGTALTELLIDKHGIPVTHSLKPGHVQDRYVAELKQAAAESLAYPVAEVIAAAQTPFLQVLYDVRATRMAVGRVALIGDAACALRPHAGAGTAKAAADAWALAAALTETCGDVVAALRRWEPGQLALSESVQRRAIAMGHRSQVASTWTPGDPALRFGLYGPGA